MMTITRKRFLQKGAWAILAALEKSKEAELVAAAKLVSLLETLLPQRTISFVAADIEHSAASVKQNNTSLFFFARYSSEGEK